MAFSGIVTKLPTFDNRAGFPSATSLRTGGAFPKDPLPSFNMNSVVSTWPNPLHVIPIKPLPGAGGGGGGGPVGSPIDSG